MDWNEIFGLTVSPTAAQNGVSGILEPAPPVLIENGRVLREFRDRPGSLTSSRETGAWRP